MDIWPIWLLVHDSSRLAKCSCEVISYLILRNAILALHAGRLLNRWNVATVVDNMSPKLVRAHILGHLYRRSSPVSTFEVARSTAETGRLDVKLPDRQLGW